MSALANEGMTVEGAAIALALAQMSNDQIFQPGQALPEGAVVIQGSVYDQATGEELGIMLPRPQWSCESEADCEWATSRLLDYDLERERLETKLAIYEENLKADIRRVERKRERFYEFMAPIVGQWAQSNLQRGKQSIQLPAAKLAFSDYKGGVDLNSKTKAVVARIKELFPHAVRPKSGEEIVPSNLDDANRQALAALIADGDPVLAKAIKVHAPIPNRFTITTGHEPGKNKKAEDGKEDDSE